MLFITHNNRLFNSLYCPSYIGKSCKVLNVWCHCYQLQPIRETEYNRGNTDFLIFSIHFRKYFQSDNMVNIAKPKGTDVTFENVEIENFQYGSFLSDQNNVFQSVIIQIESHNEKCSLILNWLSNCSVLESTSACYKCL